MGPLKAIFKKIFKFTLIQEGKDASMSFVIKM